MSCIKDLVSSKTLWFCLGPKGTQFPSATLRRIPYLGHIGLRAGRPYLAEKFTNNSAFFHRELLARDGAERESAKQRYNEINTLIEQTLSRHVNVKEYVDE